MYMGWLFGKTMQYCGTGKNWHIPSLSQVDLEVEAVHEGVIESVVGSPMFWPRKRAFGFACVARSS